MKAMFGVRGVVLMLTLSAWIPAHGLTLFSEDFEADLSNWAGKNGGGHHGLIVSDPLESDHALTFTALNGNGDIYTRTAFASATGDYILSFDYLGTCGGECWGFIGYSYNMSTVPVGGWLGGNGDPHFTSFNLPDTGQWEHVSISFTAVPDFHLTLQDNGGAAGDVYFDNILLTDGAGPTPPSVPIPGSGALLASGMVALLARFRRRLS